MRSKQAQMVTMASNGMAVPAPEDYYENDRLYHGYRKGLYMYPCDEQEKDRMDIYHKLFDVARRGHLHDAPINFSEARIMDLGCGTGIWAIDMADKYLHAEVLGLDLVNIQPEKIPPNLRFRVPNDYESFWSLGQDSWDLIHVRMACGSVSSWPELYQKIFLHLKPGCGFLEQVEVDLEPRSDDGTLPANSPVLQWYGWLADATARASRPIAYQHNTRHMLQAAGFTEIQEKIIRAPYNSWVPDPHEKDIGRWYQLALTEGLEALSLAPFTRIYQSWDAGSVKRLLEGVRQQMNSRKIHAYNNIHIWTARKPQS